jgi:hypothetical protein
MDPGRGQGCLIATFRSPEQAMQAAQALDGMSLDKKHTPLGSKAARTRVDQDRHQILDQKNRETMDVKWM